MLMAGEPQQSRLPYKTLVFGIATLICHGIAMGGQWHTVQTFHKIGSSSTGWSTVGLNVSEGLDGLSQKMLSVSSKLRLQLELIQIVHGLSDNGLGSLGATLNKFTNRPSIALNADNKFETDGSTPSQSGDIGGSLMQVGMSIVNSENATEKSDGGVIWKTQADDVDAEALPNRKQRKHSGRTRSLHKGERAQENSIHAKATSFVRGSDERGVVKGIPVVDDFVDLKKDIDLFVSALTQHLDKLVDGLEPVFEQVETWIDVYGPKAQPFIETFSSTMDTAHELFDKIMSCTSEVKVTDDEMVFESYNLFDFSNTGYVTLDDIQSMAIAYGIQVLQGGHASKLFETYDEDNNQKLNREEFRLFVQDPSTPHLMAVVLRKYSTRLSKVSGPLARAFTRSDNAKALYDYVEVVAAKNQTKINRICAALVDGTLPPSFLADFLKELAMGQENPNKLTSVDIGESIVARLVEADAGKVQAALASLQDPEFWREEGFDPLEQGTAIEALRGWVMKALGSSGRALLAEAPRRQNTTGYARVAELLRSRETRRLFAELSLMPQRSPDPDANRAVKSGVQAHPDTVKYMASVSQQASATAARLQMMAYLRTKGVGNSVDSWGTKVKGIGDKFFHTLSVAGTFGGSKGVARLRGMVEHFRGNATSELAGACAKIAPGLLSSRSLAAQFPGILAGAAPSSWISMQGSVRALEAVLPVLIEGLDAARKTSSGLSSMLNTTFTTVKKQAEPNLVKVGTIWEIIWFSFHGVWILLTLGIITFNFWYSGYLGGVKQEDTEGFEPPATLSERIRTCCASCNVCMRSAVLNRPLIFWSAMILMNIIVMVNYYVCIALGLYFAIFLLLYGGCYGIYPLNDQTICHGILQHLQSWLSIPGITFPEGSCVRQDLLTCSFIKVEMWNILCSVVICSFLAAIFSLQLLIESAVLHERARWRQTSKYLEDKVA